MHVLCDDCVAWIAHTYAGPEFGEGGVRRLLQGVQPLPTVRPQPLVMRPCGVYE